MAALKSARLWMGSLLICTCAASAQAENSCEENKDCPKGFTCTTTSGSTTPECAAVSCEAGKQCAMPPECKPAFEYKQCTPASCETDADCGERAVCYTQTIEECSGGTEVACAPNQMCPMPEPAPEPTCTEHTTKECLARYLLPCQQDNDCGEGFSCVAGEECMCAGSTPSSGGDAKPQPRMDSGSGQSGFAPVPPAADAGMAASDAAISGDPPTCECHPTELKHCELKEMSCASDADCPSDFMCASSGDRAVSCAAVPKDADAKGDAAVCEPVAPSPPEQKRCAPRGGWDVPGATRGGDFESSPDGKGAGKPTSAPQDGHAADAGVTPDLPNAEDSDDASADAPACSVTVPRAGGLNSLLVPFGLALVALGLRSRRKPR